MHLVGGVGDAYPSLIQAVLPRILYASAPPGNSAWENRRQCLKAGFFFSALVRIDNTVVWFYLFFTRLCHDDQVLKLWLERKTLSEYIIRHHIKELETLNEAAFGTSRRPSGTERALNDPLRDNEGMLVDEYGRYSSPFPLWETISTVPWACSWGLFMFLVNWFCYCIVLCHLLVGYLEKSSLTSAWVYGAYRVTGL